MNPSNSFDTKLSSRDRHEMILKAKQILPPTSNVIPVVIVNQPQPRDPPTKENLDPAPNMLFSNPNLGVPVSTSNLSVIISDPQNQHTQMDTQAKDSNSNTTEDLENDNYDQTREILIWESGLGGNLEISEGDDNEDEDEENVDPLALSSKPNRDYICDGCKRCTEFVKRNIFGAGDNRNNKCANCGCALIHHIPQEADLDEEKLCREELNEQTDEEWDSDRSDDDNEVGNYDDNYLDNSEGDDNEDEDQDYEVF